MLKDNEKITVINRDNGTVGYTVPDLNNLHRSFQPREKKIVTMEELRKLSYLPGGEYLLKNCLILDNQDAISELIGTVEPEYFYSEKEIKELLDNGSLDQLEDCLDFAPKGVIDLLKQIAIDTELNDIRKRALIFHKTGFNITKAIEINSLEKDNKKDSEENKVRKAAPVAEPQVKTRKAGIPAYKIISQ